MTNDKKRYLIVAVFLILAGIGALVFFTYYKSQNSEPSSNNSDNFIQNTFQMPAVEGNIVNSGIIGLIVLENGTPFEAGFDIFESGNFPKPFISIRAHDDGTFQVPLKPGSYVLKPMDPDGPIAPVRSNYSFSIGDGQWLQVKIEYKK
ncbi:MAG: hypothetical protein Q7K16_00355 [Candidatus Azambacteria bacterium]|nr:hypothetical protein [Candidatus Azambacteria bacterium]